MALNINTIVQDTDALGAQSCALLIPGRAADGQADPASGAEHAMPGQSGVAGQLAQGAADPSCGAPESRQLGELAITHDLSFGYLRQGQVERRTSDLRGAFGFVSHIPAPLRSELARDGC